MTFIIYLRAHWMCQPLLLSPLNTRGNYYLWNLYRKGSAFYFYFPLWFCFVWICKWSLKERKNIENPQYRTILYFSIIMDNCYWIQIPEWRLQWSSKIFFNWQIAPMVCKLSITKGSFSKVSFILLIHWFMFCLLARSV